MRISELLELLRIEDIFDIHEVEIAIMEVSGKLSIMKKSQFQTVTLKDMKIKSANKGLNTDLIYDGIILEPNLEKRGLSKKWLYEQLYKQSIKDPSEVFYATINSSGEIYIAKYEDHINTNIIPESYSNKREVNKENENS